MAMPAANTLKKIQLCVCFPTDDTLQLSLIFKETEKAKSIPIVSLTTPKKDFNTSQEFVELNELYYILSSIANAENSGFLMDENLTVTINDKFDIKSVLPNINNIEKLNKDIKEFKKKIEAEFKLSDDKYLLKLNNIVNYKTGSVDESYKISRFNEDSTTLTLTLTLNLRFKTQTINISYDDFFKNMSITGNNIDKIATKINSANEIKKLKNNSKNFVLLIRVLNSKDNFKPYYYQDGKYMPYDPTVTTQISEENFDFFEIYATKIKALDDLNVPGNKNESGSVPSAQKLSEKEEEIEKEEKEEKEEYADDRKKNKYDREHKEGNEEDENEDEEEGKIKEGHKSETIHSKREKLSVSSAQNLDLETNGGYFDSNKKIFYSIDGQGKYKIIKNITFNNSTTDNTDNKAKYNKNKITITVVMKNEDRTDINDIDLKNIGLIDSAIDNAVKISETSFKHELRDGNLIIYKAANTDNWFPGIITEIIKNEGEEDKYKIEPLLGGTVGPLNRSDIRYIQTDENGKILTSEEVKNLQLQQHSASGGNPIPTPKTTSNYKTTKKQRRQRKRAGKTRRPKPI